MSGRLYIGTGDDALCDLIHVNGKIAYVEYDYKSTNYVRAHFYCPKGFYNGFQVRTLGGTFYDGTYYYPVHMLTITTSSTDTYSYDFSLVSLIVHYIDTDNTTSTFASFSPNYSYSKQSITWI